MITTLHAQPYDFAAAGFYFESTEEFGTNSAALLLTRHLLRACPTLG